MRTALCCTMISRLRNGHLGATGRNAAGAQTPSTARSKKANLLACIAACVCCAGTCNRKYPGWDIEIPDEPYSAQAYISNPCDSEGRHRFSPQGRGFAGKAARARRIRLLLFRRYSPASSTSSSVTRLGRWDGARSLKSTREIARTAENTGRANHSMPGAKGTRNAAKALCTAFSRCPAPQNTVCTRMWYG